MKKLLKKIWGLMNDARYEKAVMILLPCLALLVSALILLPQVRAFSAQLTAEAEGALPVVRAAALDSAATPAPTATPVPTATPIPDVETKLNAASMEKDMYITVCDRDGKPVSGQKFELTVTYPGGEVYGFATEQDGSCYLVNLYAGEYSISMNSTAGYKTAAAIKCTVKEHVEYTKIENIDAVISVKDVSEIPESETKPASTDSAPAATVAEVIQTPAEAAGVDAVVEEKNPVLDSNGNQTYTYTCGLGPNGFLLYRGTQEESAVIPVDENNDGTPDYGLSYVAPAEPAAPESGSSVVIVGETPAAEQPETEQGYYVSEPLFKEDNTPVDAYEITATPIVAVISKTVGWQNHDGKLYYYDAEGNKVTGLKKIDGVLYYFNQYGAKASSLGIDVSFYNEDINWQAVKAQGIDFAIIRVGGRTWRTGELYDDSRTQEYLREARDAGLKIGVYFYSTAVNGVEAVQEASVALSKIDGISLDYPVFIDMEYSGIYPEGRADDLSVAQRSEVIRAFCETVASSGYRPGVYSGQYFIQNNLDYSVISNYTIWLASYTSGNKLPSFGKWYDMWQFTDRGQVGGINGGVDMNVIF